MGTIYVSETEDGRLIVRARAEGPGGLVGDFVDEMAPGDPPLFGYTYEELREHGPGELPMKSE